MYPLNKDLRASSFVFTSLRNPSFALMYFLWLEKQLSRNLLVIYSTILDSFPELQNLVFVV